VECSPRAGLGGEVKLSFGRKGGGHRRVLDDGVGESGSSIFGRSGYNHMPVR